MPLCEASRSEVIDSISQFLSPQNYFQVCFAFATAVHMDVLDIKIREAVIARYCSRKLATHCVSMSKCMWSNLAVRFALGLR